MSMVLNKDKVSREINGTSLLLQTRTGERTRVVRP